MSQGGPSRACNSLGSVPVTTDPLLRTQDEASRAPYYKAAAIPASSLGRLIGPDSQQVRTCWPMQDTQGRPLDRIQIDTNKEAGKSDRSLELFQVTAGSHEEEHRNREHEIHARSQERLPCQRGHLRRCWLPRFRRLPRHPDDLFLAGPDD